MLGAILAAVIPALLCAAAGMTVFYGAGKKWCAWQYVLSIGFSILVATGAFSAIFFWERMDKDMLFSPPILLLSSLMLAIGFWIYVRKKTPRAELGGMVLVFVAVLVVQFFCDIFLFSERNSGGTFDPETC